MVYKQGRFKKTSYRVHAIKLAAVAELKNSNISSSHRAVLQPRRPQGLLSCRCHIGKQNEKTLGRGRAVLLPFANFPHSKGKEQPIWSLSVSVENNLYCLLKA